MQTIELKAIMATILVHSDERMTLERAVSLANDILEETKKQHEEEVAAKTASISWTMPTSREN
jgi:hypothetical protein